MGTISFKQFVNEAVVKSWEQLDMEEFPAIDLLNAHCKDGLKAISEGKLLYRGDEASGADFRKIDPSKGIRTSADTNNIYQLMFDNSPNLQQFPKRSSSLICSTSIIHAGAYGTSIYAVFPFDGSQIAVSDKPDFIVKRIYAPFFDGDASLQSASRVFSIFLQNLGHKRPSKYESIDELDSFLSKFDAEVLTLLFDISISEKIGGNIITLDSIDDENIRSEWASQPIAPSTAAIDYFKKNGFKDKRADVFYRLMKDNPKNRFTSLASYLFTPSKLGVSLVTYPNIPTLNEEHEVWFSNPAILVKLGALKKILQRLDDINFPIHSAIKKELLL